MANELVFAPLGGVGEIGMNLSIYYEDPDGNVIDVTANREEWRGVRV